MVKNTKHVENLVPWRARKC